MNGQESKAPKKAKKRIIPRWLTRLILLLICAGVLCYGGLVAYVCYVETHVPAPGPYDSIIVLGAQVLPSGEPSVQLRWRLDTAIEMYRANPCPIVVCGAQGGNEPAPEGQIMRQLLLSDGLPAEHVFADTQSEDTKENMKNAWAILSPQGCEAPLIVTSDYHLPRALSIAKDSGLAPQGVGSPCKPGLEYWSRNHLREALAWVKYWGIKYLGLKL